MYRLFLALRYLLTRPINLLGVFGIALSVWALVVVVSLFSGFLAVIARHVHGASADVTVSGLPPGTGWPGLQAELRGETNVAAVAPRVVHYGLLHRPGRRPGPPALPGRTALHGGDQPFLFVLGVDPAAESQATGFAGWLVDPVIPAELRAADPREPLRDRGDRAAVLVGLDRMRAEGLRPGDELVLTTGTMRDREDGARVTAQVQIPLVVAGAFKTQHGGFDGNNLFVGIEVLRRHLFDGASVVQEAAVRVADPQDLDGTAARLSRAVQRAVDRGDQRARGIAQTWRQKNAGFLESVEHQRALLKIVLVVILVTAAFLMLATLSMMVTEKTADIGILAAMGGTPLGTTQVFLACGLTITGAGVALGLGTGCITAVYLEEVRQVLRWATGIDLFPLEVYNLDRVPWHLDPWWLLQVTLMAFATGFLASALPALRAARHDPLVSLRNA
ncbi:MAG: ABC transporter permease [Planctomycetes bacterium]|nr:ABC transporter permease [Planctomycetota bacterium]